MIVDLPDTSIGAVGKRLLGLREDVGSMALGRVLTLVVAVDDAHAEDALSVANDATHQHPSRIVAVVGGNPRGSDRIDAQIRVGGDAGASEIVILRLYGELTRHGEAVVLPLLLADSPVVAWWPHGAPKDLGKDPVGGIATRRITDAEHTSDPSRSLSVRARSYRPGDTDLVWTRTTKWRGLLAAALDRPPYESVTSATVTGGHDSASSDLLGAWLAAALDCPVTRARTPAGTGLVSVRLRRPSGDVDLVRPDGTIATLEQPGQPARRLALPRRGEAECLADELARLDPDEVYGEALVDGLPRLARRGMPASEAVSKGLAPDIEDSRRLAAALDRRTRRRHEAGGAGAE